MMLLFWKVYMINVFSHSDLHCIVKAFFFYFLELTAVWFSFLSGATTIEKYDLRTNLWIQAGMMNGRRLQFGVAVIDDKLFVIGGRDGLKTLNTVECYNPKTKTWTVLPPMATHRHGLGKAYNYWYKFWNYFLKISIF